MTGTMVPAVEKTFHFADCTSACHGACTAELREGNAKVLGQFDRDQWANDARLLATVFVGNYADPSTWKREPRPSTAAAVDVLPEWECRHFVPSGEWCPDCNPVDEGPEYEEVPLW